MNKSEVSVAQAAAKLGISAVRLRVLCREGRVKGAKKIGGVWVMPPTPQVTTIKERPSSQNKLTMVLQRKGKA